MNSYIYPGLYSAKEFNHDAIKKMVSEFFEVSIELMEGKKRNRNIVFPRQVCMWILEKYGRYNLTLKEIGVMFCRHHTTVIHSRQTVDDLIDTNEGIRDQIQQLEESIRQTFNILPRGFKYRKITKAYV